MLTMTPAVPWAPINQASKTEKSSDVAIPPSNLPIMRIVKFLKSFQVHNISRKDMRIVLGVTLQTIEIGLKLTFGHTTQSISHCK